MERLRAASPPQAVPVLPHQCGVTLIELLVSMAILGILTAMAAPALSSLVANQRGKAMATDLYLSLIKARSEALKRNISVSLTPATVSHWEAGWTIPDPSGSSHPIESHGAISGVTITGPNSVIYRSSGRVLATTAPSFDISASGSATHWCVSVDLSGRPSSKAGTCSP